MIKVDGSTLEGGGQILRTSLALATATQTPCQVFNIRQLRPKPGLAPQHLLGIQALARLSNGRLEGDQLGSKEIKFYPGNIERGQRSLNIRIETAGSITLLLQTLIPSVLLVKEPIEINIDGGATDTFFSPTIDHFRYCFLKILEKLGGKVDINIEKRGYYPEGGAKVQAIIHPSQLNNLNLTERGGLRGISIISGASQSLQSKKVAERQIAGVREVLGELKLPLEEKVEYYNTQCPGSQICLIGEFENTVIGTDNLGKMGKRAEDIGKEAALELLKEQKTKTCLDKHLADQILPYLALTKGKSSITVSEITNHFKTNIWVIEKFIKGKFKIEDDLINWTPLN